MKDPKKVLKLIRVQQARAIHFVALVGLMEIV